MDAPPAVARTTHDNMLLKMRNKQSQYNAAVGPPNNVDKTRTNTGRFNHADPAREIPGRSNDATQRTNDAPGHPNDGTLTTRFTHVIHGTLTIKIIFIMPVTMVTRQSPTSGPPVFTLLEPPRPTSHKSQDLAVSENTKDCSRYELNDGVGCGQQSRTC